MRLIYLASQAEPKLSSAQIVGAAHSPAWISKQVHASSSASPYEGEVGEAGVVGTATSGERVRVRRRFERSRERERVPKRERLCEKPSEARSEMVLELARGEEVPDRVDEPVMLR